MILSEAYQYRSTQNKQSRHDPDPAIGFFQKDDADQDTHHNAYLPYRNGIAYRRQIEPVAKGEKRGHHDRSAAEDQAPVFAQFRSYVLTVLGAAEVD